MWLIAYGSLMNKGQFSGKACKLVVVKGWKRLFNKTVSRSVWKKHAHDINIGTLNVQKNKNSYFNAIAYEVGDKEFLELLKREEYYRTEKAEAFDFKTNERLGSFIIFVSDKTQDSIKPVEEYLEVCRKGAYSWGKNFGKEFDKTTFTAKGQSIEDFLKNGPDGI